mgnify:CR=1
MWIQLMRKSDEYVQVDMGDKPLPKMDNHHTAHM